MSHALTTPMTGAEYLAWEARQELPWEFDGLRPVAMNGGTAVHNLIQGNLFASLHTRLAGKECRVYGSGLKVPTPSGSYRYPDTFVSCASVPLTSRLADHPVVIFEVLSESTNRADRTVKLIEYRALPSLRRYVMLEQDQVLATVIARFGEVWSIDVLRAGEVLAMPEIGVEVPMDEIYAGLDLPPIPVEDDATTVG